MTFLKFLILFLVFFFQVLEQDDEESSSSRGHAEFRPHPQQLGEGNFGDVFQRMSVSDPGLGNNNVQSPLIGIGHHPPVSGLPPPVPARPLHIQQSHQFWSFGHFSDGVGGHTQSGQLSNTP